MQRLGEGSGGQGWMRRLLAWIILGSLWLAGGDLARANVAPEATVLIHVRPPAPPGPEGCTFPGITYCHQLVNSSDLTGPVEFDVFVQPWFAGPPDEFLVSFQTVLTWPASWQFISWEPCGEVEATFTPGSGNASLSGVWPGCPLSASLNPVGRLILDVSGYGRLQPAFDGVLAVNCPQPTSLEAIGVFAEAGVTCDFTHLTCTPWSSCLPTLSQASAAFSAGPGGALSADIPFTALSSTGDPCSFTVQTEASWLVGSYEQINSMSYVLNLSCDVVGLAPGNYASRVLLTRSPYASSRRCVDVTLEVPANSSVPGADGAVRYVPLSWGKLKAGVR